MSVLIFLIILAFLILSHEFGHFWAAKRSGIRVDEFGLGFPPRLWGVKKGETIYSINLIPFGGFVKIFGENPADPELTAGAGERGLINKPKLTQALVLVAGVAANLVVAWLLISLGLSFGLPTPLSQLPADYAGLSRVLITSVAPESPAQIAGLQPGDALVYLGEELPENGFNPDDITITTKLVEEFVAEHQTSEFVLGYQRGRVFTQTDLPTHWVRLTPVMGLLADRAAIGIGMDETGLLKLGPLSALGQGLVLTGRLSVATARALGGFIIDAFRGQPVLEQVTGPVGLAGLVGDAKNLGWIYLLSFTAIISINLAVINLMPFPALDGGRLLFLLIEKLKGSPIKPKIANAFNLVGFALLLLLMLVVTYRDIVKLF